MCVCVCVLCKLCTLFSVKYRMVLVFVFFHLFSCDSPLKTTATLVATDMILCWQCVDAGWTVNACCSTSVLVLAEQWMHVAPPLWWCWLNSECMLLHLCDDAGWTVNACCSTYVLMLAEQWMHVAPPLCWCWLNSECMLTVNACCSTSVLMLAERWMHVAPPLCAGGLQPDYVPGTGHKRKATQRSPWVADLDHFQGENENGNNNDNAVLSFCCRWAYKCILRCLGKMGMMWFRLQVHFEVLR